MNDSSAVCSDDERKAWTLVSPDSAALRSHSRLLSAFLPFLSLDTTLPVSSLKTEVSRSTQNWQFLEPESWLNYDSHVRFNSTPSRYHSHYPSFPL